MTNCLRFEQQTGVTIQRHHIAKAVHITRLNFNTYSVAPGHPLAVSHTETIPLGNATAICLQQRFHAQHPVTRMNAIYRMGDSLNLRALPGQFREAFETTTTIYRMGDLHHLHLVAPLQCHHTLIADQPKAS